MRRQASCIEIRPASVADAKRISHIHAASWKTAYQGMVPQAYLDALSEDHWVEPFTKWLQSGELEAIIAYVGENPVGCISFGTPIDTSVFGIEELPTGYAEVRSLYIHPDYMRSGYGRALLQAAEFSMRQQGVTHSALFVLDQNLPARAFYEKNGYAWDGTKVSYNIMGQAITDLRYVKSLSCPCPRRCKTHGDCISCKEKHAAKKHPCYCLRSS